VLVPPTPTAPRAYERADAKRHGPRQQTGTVRWGGLDTNPRFPWLSVRRSSLPPQRAGETTKRTGFDECTPPGGAPPPACVRVGGRKARRALSAGWNRQSGWSRYQSHVPLAVTATGSGPAGGPSWGGSRERCVLLSGGASRYAARADCLVPPYPLRLRLRDFPHQGGRTGTGLRRVRSGVLRSPDPHMRCSYRCPGWGIHANGC